MKVLPAVLKQRSENVSRDMWKHAWKESRAHVRHEEEQVIVLRIDNENRPKVPADLRWLGG